MGMMKVIKDRICTNFIKNKKIFIACLAIWIIALTISLNIYSTTLGNKATGNFFYGYIISEPYELNKDTIIVQEIPVREDTSGISIHFSTYARKNKGNVYIEVIGKESGFIYSEKTINVSNIQDNAFYSFDIKNNDSQSQDKYYVIRLSSNSEPNQSVGVQKTTQKRIKNTKLSINSKIIEDEDLIVRYICKSATAHKFYINIISFVIISITLLIVVLFLIQPNKEWYYLLLTLIVGVVFIFIITPYSIPDEYHHTTVVNELASKVMYGDPKKVDEYYLQPETFEVNYNRGTVYRTIIDDWDKKLELTGNYLKESNVSEGVYYAYYIPQTLGVIIGRLLKMNFFKTFYMGRFFNLFFYSICIFISVKKTPILKTMFGIVSCLPIFIQQASSYSYDSFINGLCFITAAYLLKWLIEEKKIKIVDYIIVFICCLAIAPAKYVYGFFALLYWLVPSNRFGSFKKKLLFVSILCLPMLYQLVPILGPRIIKVFDKFFATKVVSADTNETKDILLAIEEEQEVIQMFDFKYSLSHSREVVDIVLRTLRYNLKTWFYGSVGRYLSSLTITLPLRLIHCILLVIVSSILIKEEKYISNIVRVFIVGICGLMGLFTVGGMLLYWTSVNDLYIQGVQGRYFCPLLPYFFSIFNNKKISIPKKYDGVINYAYLLCILEVILYVLSYTFVN